MSRLTARFWVDAYLTRLRVFDIPGFVVSHGDDTGGAVLIKLNTLDGQAVVFHRSFDLQSDARVTRQRGFDPDLWVVEVEDRAGRHLLDHDGLA